MTPVSISEENRIWIDRFRRLGLGSFTPLLLDVLRPLGFLGSQVMIMAAPLLTTFTDPAKLESLTALLEDPDRLHEISQIMAQETDL